MATAVILNFPYESAHGPLLSQTGGGKLGKLFSGPGGLTRNTCWKRRATYHLLLAALGVCFATLHKVCHASQLYLLAWKRAF